LIGELVIWNNLYSQFKVELKIFRGTFGCKFNVISWISRSSLAVEAQANSFFEFCCLLKEEVKINQLAPRSSRYSANENSTRHHHGPNL
jgi:hypothetical protein